MQSLNAIAVTYGYMGRYDEALARLNEALDLARSDPIGSEHRLPAREHRRDLQRPRPLQGGGRGARGDAGVADSENRMQRLTQLTNSYVGLGLKARALETAEQAVALSKGMPPDDIAMVLAARAWAFQALGRFEAASADLQGALAAVEDLRVHTVPDDFLKRGFGQRYQWVFASSISLLQAQGRTREAIETAERARARAFLDLLASRQQTPARMRRRRPRDAVRRRRRSPRWSRPPRACARRSWRTGSATPRRSSGWSAPSGRLATARIDVTAAELVVDGTGRDRRRSGRTGPPRWCRPRRASLARPLPAPARSGAPASADGGRQPAHHRAARAALRAAVRRAPRSRPIGISIETYDIHYVPAIGALSDASRARRPSTALLVGDPSPDASRDRVLALPALPWAGREVEAIATDDDERLRPTVLTGSAATESGVRQSVAGKSLLHFATHGIVQNEERLSSYLALSGGQPPEGRVEDATTDGRLTADETYDLDLDAELIVLSGCRTALGPIMGDGVIGFTRGFLAAGASSVVATMWDVPDQTSFEVMRAFYRAWVGTGSATNRAAGKSRSLRQAQLAVLRALRAGKIQVNGVTLPESPRLWAGYVLVGEP